MTSELQAAAAALPETVTDERLREAVAFLKWLRPMGPEQRATGLNGAVKYDLTLSDIEAALAELAELRKASQWMPIKTAPRNGSRLLLAADWTDKLKVKQVAYGHWYELGPYWAYDGYQFGNPECQPTHWRPLPPPPAKETGHE
jgi:hypothetical protein